MAKSVFTDSEVRLGVDEDRLGYALPRLAVARRRLRQRSKPQHRDIHLNVQCLGHLRCRVRIPNLRLEEMLLLPVRHLRSGYCMRFGRAGPNELAGLRG